MAPKLPMGEQDNWATPLTQQEAEYVWSVIGWAAKKGIKLDPATVLNLPAVSTGVAPTAPVEDDYQQRYAPTVSLYSDLAGPDEIAGPQQIIATYVMQGKKPKEILQIIKDNPDEFPLSTGSDFERQTDYVRFIGSLSDEWSTYERVFKDETAKYENDASKYVTDPYAKLKLPSESSTYKPDATYAKIPQTLNVGGRSYKSTPREDALLLAMARAIDDKYIIPGLQSEMRPPTTTPPADVQMSGTPKTLPIGPDEILIGKQRSQLAKEFAARGMSGNYGLGAGPIAGALPTTPQGGPSRPVVSGMSTTISSAPKQTVDTTERARQKALMSKLNTSAQRGF